MAPSGSRSARQSRGRGRGRGVSRVRAPAASSSVSTKAVSRGGVRGRRARSRAQGRSRMSTAITPHGMSPRCDSEPMSLDECASETGSHDDEDMELHYSDGSDSGLHSGSASNEAHKVNQVTYADLKEENKENLLPNKREYEETPVARKEGAKEDPLVHNEARVDTIELKEEVKEESLDQKEESMDADNIVSVLGSEVPALSGELLQRLRGLLPARAALARLARAVTRLARPRKQQQITKYFPVINRSNAAEAEHQPSASKIAPSDVQDDKPKNSNITPVTNKTENEQTDVNKHEVEQRRPSWDVAGPSHRTHVISEEDDMDAWSLGSSPCARSPDEEPEDIDTLLPPVSFSQKEPSSGGRRVKEELNRSTPSARGSGRDTKRGRGARGRASLDARQDNSELLDVFLSKMSDITSAAELPFEMPKNAGKVQLSNPGEEEDEELGVAETYANYVPAKLSYGCPHPDPVVETSSLSSVDIADVTHQLGLPPATIEGGSLSALQLEAVVYAAQAHHHVLPDGMRAGFLIGDGAGVGKGRTIAGIIFENYLAGRKRAVWVSVSNDLKYDAERDLRDIGAAHIPVHQLSKMAYTAIAATHGVVFSTYSSLIGRTSAAGATYKRRLEQLVAWCGPHFDGCIVFDECHRAKNLCPTSATSSSETGKAVLELQVSLPLARLVYASATGASEPRNMAYMARLGIWGAGSPFPAFRDFLKAVEKRGVGAMEIVAMDMKLRGMYIARQLSFHGVTFKIEEVPLSPQFRDTYDKAVALWVEAKKSFESCTELIDPCKRWRRVMWAQFWGAHQRFFKYLCIAAKVHRTVELTKEAVQQGKCVVIGLQATGEARTLDQLERGRGTLTEFICTAKGVFVSLVEKQFPCPNNMQEEDYENGRPSSRVEDSTNAACAKLLADIECLGRSLPPNTLDELIDCLGGPAVVAEMTGRKGRVVATDGKILYESRSEADVPLETLNLTEKQRFMDGEKDVAIISEAASSGISLQSDRRVANQKRRVHITLELPWSADRAIQQFGRTHRSNQVNAPEYIFLISDLAGERRFASTVAKRLESLGALTHGDRRATETRDLSQFNIENKHGRAAYRSMVYGIFGSASPLVPPPPCYPGDFLQDAAAALRDVGIERHEESAGLIPRFLNRLLGVRVTLQNALFQHFNDTFSATVKEAKRAGRFDLGILDVGASGQVVRRAARARYLRTHATGRAPVELHTLLVERGMEWEKAERKFSECARAGEGFYLARTASNNVRNAILCVAHDATRDLAHACLYNVYRPNLGMQPQPERLADITSKYVKVVPRQAEHAWRAHYQGSLTRCTHAWWHGHCKNISCEVGTRRRTYYVLSGSVLAAWRTLEATYRDLRLDSRMQVVRVHTHEGLKIIGTLVPKYMVELLSHRLKSGALSVEEEKYDV